jgi:hypothetical protein
MVEIKRTYLQLATQYHPDKVAHLAPEFRALAEQRMKDLNAAYDAIKKIRHAPAWKPDIHSTSSSSQASQHEEGSPSPSAGMPADQEVFMAYTAEISRTVPSCFLFLIDQSGSMEDRWARESGKSKADSLADIVNRLLMNIVIRCTKEEGVRDYFDIGVIGYGSNVGPAFGGALAGREVVPVSDVANRPTRIEERTRKVEDGAGGLVDQTVKFPIWFDPTASGGTPMCHAFTEAQKILSRWITQHPTSFPPIVFNITDGEATDGDPTDAANLVKNLTTNDGNVLLFNVHVSSTQAASIQFPESEVGLPDNFAKVLFGISSPLPGYMRTFALQEGLAASDGARGFVFNADPVAVIQFLEIGTRPSNLR